ncbi:MAG: cytochrome c oxidase assembly protein [Gammaproteobacteria bacterium]|nr:cytochrome c oxidase assembly protein [Gammaproteobacteria bacterium]
MAEGKHSKTVTMLVAMVFFMSGFSFALVPLYDVFCEVTGLNGKTAEGPAAISKAQVDTDRTVKVQFLTNLNNQAPWKFKADVYEMKVHPGQMYETSFYAQNLTADKKVAQAVASVSPGLAAEHFNKTECFCFNEQAFEANEGKDMPLRFMVNPELPKEITTLTLSYTFFELDKLAKQ